MDDRLLLTVAEAQRSLNIGRTKIYELVASGQLPSVRLGRSLRIPARALEEWVEANQKDATGFGE